MKAPRPPHLPLGDLESILCDVSTMLGHIPGAPGVVALDARVVQCLSAITACRRHDFSPTLLRALSAKVLEVETDALVLQRTAPHPRRQEAPAREDGARAKKRPRKRPW
jgi:hypothetical protein